MFNTVKTPQQLIFLAKIDTVGIHLSLKIYMVIPLNYKSPHTMESTSTFILRITQ
jgi:hypothetical protein